MQERSTSPTIPSVLSVKNLILAIALIFSGVSVSAQNFCANETVLWTENFGANIIVASSPDVINLGYQPAGGLEDSFYRITYGTQQRPEWHDAPDHTPNDIYGDMLIVNGAPVSFYTHTITNGTTGFLPGSYAASLFLMNVNTPGTCAPAPLLPTLTFSVEYNTSATGNAGWIQLQNVTANSVPQSANPTWVQLGGVFNIPALAQRVRLSISAGISSGCGNDFAIDDIKFATCPDGGPLPVDFINITAAQKGGGVAVNWSTASEHNNKYFDVEKSIDGNNWTTINSLGGAGNSSTLKNYSSYDSKPIAGYNYYRIKQVDIDGKFKYSNVAKAKIVVDRTGVTVLANPFVNNITVDFLSNTNQSVSVRLTDISGKVIASEKWKVAKGSSRLIYNNVNNIQRGMYIFTVTDDNGNVIYNNKLMKQ
jgi:Secretion system C-terminal sorting domain